MSEGFTMWAIGFTCGAAYTHVFYLLFSQRKGSK